MGWILLECHGSCIINGGNMTKYFKLEKGAFLTSISPVPVYIMFLSFNQF